MNYREKIRKAIERPQFGYATYGEWGALKLEQRIYIKRLLDELDSADNYIKNVYLENQKYKEVIDKAIEYINENLTISSILDGKKYYTINNYSFDYIELLDILKEVE